MAKKTYKTFSLKKLYTYIRNEAGEKVPIVFQGGIQVDSTAIFSTTSEMIQKGLESAPGFNRDYYLESVREDTPTAAPTKAPAAKEEVVEEPVVEEKVADNGNVVEVSDKNDAIEWLKEHCPDKGYTAVKLHAKAAFDAACKECGVEFKFTA